MSFRNVPDDLTLPPTGQLIPGSGTLYIGSKQIPADLLADGALAAFVWFSNSAGLAVGIDYWYIAHLRIGTQADLFQAGYKPTGGTRKAIWGGWLDGSGNQFSTYEAQNNVNLQSSLKDVTLNSLAHDIIGTAARAVFLEGDFAGPGAVQLISPNGNIGFGKASGIPGVNARIGGWSGGGTRAYIKAGNTDQETWNSDTSTQTFGGIAGCTVTVEWRITIDYIVEVRFQVHSPSNVPNTNLVFALPAAVPQCAGTDPFNLGLREIARVASSTGNHGFAPDLWQGSTSNVLIDYTNTTVGGINGVDFYGQFIYTIDKP